MQEIILLSLAIFGIAFLYASVGHGGASGYLAVMALFSFTPLVMRPTALVLNILVSLIGTIQFYRAGYFNWRTFLTFTISAVPMAYLGGKIILPTAIYKPLVGLVLLYSAFRLFFEIKNKLQQNPEEIKEVPLLVALPTGGILGLLSGLTGVGGGIFLSPLLILMNWATVKNTAGISAAFILLNSISGLWGRGIIGIPDFISYLIFAALIGGLLGAYLGSRQFANLTIRKLLAFTLLIAGIKMIFGV